MIAAMALAAAMAARCDWSKPGNAPTSSAPAATLAAMGINSPELGAKIAAGDYDELVTIRRNDTRMRGMSSGNAKWCAGEVDTSRWSADHEEQGRVYRFGNLAVVWFWRCHNMSFWRADSAEGSMSAALAAPAEPAYLDGEDLIPAGPIGNAPGYAALLPAAAPIVEGGYAAGSWGGSAGGGFGNATYYPPGQPGQHATCDCKPLPPPCPPITPAVPEASTWVLIAIGLVVVLISQSAHHKAAL